MQVITGRNVNWCLPMAMKMLSKLGVKISPRGQDTLEYPSPVCTTYLKPMERVLFEPMRDSNPFFTLMEALWILGGRNDVAWITQFNKGLRQYSDDGETYHGAYGHRLRKCGIDQINEVVEKLKKDPDTRQAVLQIWDFNKDLKTDSKDRPCLSGDTIMRSPEGDISIFDLYSRFDKGLIDRYPLYSFNEQYQEFEFDWCYNVFYSGVKSLLKITLDDGTSVKVTPDHRLYKNNKNSSYSIVEAGEIKIGDYLTKTIFSIGRKGHIDFKKRLFENTNFNNVKSEHQEYYRFIYGNWESEICMDIHHIDGNPANNSINNLQLIDHNLHAKIDKHGINNPIHKEDEISRRKRLTKRRNSLRKRGWNVPDHEDDLIFKDEQLPVKIEKVRKKHTFGKVVSIEEIEEGDVYDFQMENNHNCLIESGIVVHNCNDMVFLKIRNGKLNITVANRSNDVIWGAYGTNVVQFSMLQEYLAARIGCEVGVYNQVSDSFHVYTNNPQWEKLKNINLLPYDPYVINEVENYPLVSHPETFDEELTLFLDGGFKMDWKNDFFVNVAIPMYDCWFAHKTDNTGWMHLNDIEATDWRLACKEWLERRGDVKLD